MKVRYVDAPSLNVRKITVNVINVEMLVAVNANVKTVEIHQEVSQMTTYDFNY
jgi:hypothetical protein